MFARFSLPLALTFMFGATVFAQSDSAKTQAVFAAEQLEERCASDFARYERFESGGRLLEAGSSGLLTWPEITKSLRHELSAVTTLYLKALDSGWEPTDAELATTRATLEAMADRMEKVGVWTCFRWEDAALEAAERDRLDHIRLRAWQASLLVETGKLDDATGEFQFARKLVSEIDGDIEDALDAGRDVQDTRQHAAYARTLAEVERLEASVAGALGQVEESRARLQQDVNALAAAAKQHAPFLMEIQNARAPSGTEDGIIEAIDKRRKQLDEFDAGAGVQARKSHAEFGERYGTDRDAITAAVIRIMGNESLDSGESPPSLYDGLDRGLKRIPVLREELTGQLLEIAEDNAGTQANDPAQQEEAFTRARRCIDLALQIDPGNAEAQRLADSLGAGAAAAAEKTEELLDQGTWEDHLSSFQGPGSANDLAESAHEWLAADAGWTKDKDVLAVRVNGDWLVAEKDREGETLTWGLPIEVAFERHADRDAKRDAAIVFRLTMVTTDTEKSPPWKMARVGSTRQMRASNVSSSGGGGGSGPNALFMLLLVAALLVSGVLLVGPAIPALGPLLGMLTPLRPLLGVSTLGIGVVLLLFNLLSPFSDILPQAAAIIAGLFLGLELLLRRAPNGQGNDPQAQAERKVDAAVGKAQDILEGQKEMIGKISGFQTPLGAACLLLALLHLFASGAPLL
jgi:hypothetical protein